MKIWRILKSLERLEDRMADLYETVRQQYPTDPGAAAFFAQMRDEELGHRDLVRYQQRILFRAPENYADLPDYDEAGLGEAERTAEALIGRVARLPLAEFLEAAVALECAATEQHYRSVLGQVSSTLGRLVAQLGAADQAHAAKLDRFARAHGVDPSHAAA
jgi:hypothetical protein